MKENFSTYLKTLLSSLQDIYKLHPIDRKKLEEIANEVEKNFTDINVVTEENVLYSLLQNVILLMIDKGDVTILEKHIRQNPIISIISLVTINSCKHIEIKSNKYNDFPYWSFGVHYSKKNTMLFGCLEIQEVYGFYMLKDSHSQMVCIIINKCLKTDLEISQLRNSYVLIEKYTVVTEIFNERQIPNLEYIIVNVENIHVILSSNNNINNISQPNSCELNYQRAMSFGLLRKSTVCLGANNSSELLLQVFVRFNCAELFCNEAYLVLPSTYVPLNLQLKEGSLYIMYYKTPLKEITNSQLTAMKKLKIFQVQDKDCYFQLVNCTLLDMPKPLSIQECKSFIQNSTDLVSFQGVIRTKRFTNSRSKSVRTSSLYGFGTPGEKVHQIVFSQIDNNQVIFLDCYLNNWENMLMPFGLVPEMEVIVRNVLPQSKKYLKSTIFTTIEIVSYNPQFIFNTVNLYKDENDDWGIPTYLSQGHKIPVGVLVWGQVFGVFVQKLTIDLKCAKCKLTVDNQDGCSTCKVKNFTIEFTVKFNTVDQYGQSIMTSNSLEVLRVLLNLKPADFEEWLTTFNSNGLYCYNHFDEMSYAGNSLWNDLTNYLNKIGEKQMFLDLKCRKVEGSPLVTEKKPSWHCIDIRRQ